MRFGNLLLFRMNLDNTLKAIHVSLVHAGRSNT